MGARVKDAQHSSLDNSYEAELRKRVAVIDRLTSNAYDLVIEG